jgi:hypothetical protein
MFQYLSSWFQINDNDDENEREEEQDEVEKEETKKTIKRPERDEVPDTDLIKDRKRYRAKDITVQQNLPKIKKVKKSVRYVTRLTTKTKKRRY